jgi:DNA-binding GntR family transcriptional regulator
MIAVVDDQHSRNPGRTPRPPTASAAGGVISMAGLIQLDRSSPVPLYYQVAQHLEEAIDSGLLPPGSRLDNEIQLAQRLALSRPTVRRAIQYLVDKGLLVRKRGVGTRVVHAQVKRRIELTSLYDDLARTGQRPATSVLSNRVEPASRAVAEALNIPEGTPVTALDRLRYAQAEPIARLCNYLPATVPGLTTQALEQTGLYQLIRAQSIRLHAAIQTIGARGATVAEARLLGEKKGAPLLTMQRIAYDDQGAAIEYGTHVYRASRYGFEQGLRA